MGIERLTSSLLKEAEQESVKIIESAKWHVEEMVKEERKKEAEMRKKAEEEVKRLLEEQRTERLAWARLEGKRIIADAKEDAIRAAIDTIYESASEIRKTKEYATFLSKSVEEAVQELGGQAKVHVLKGEKKLLQKIKAEVLENLEGLGGALVESADGKTVVDLRLETALELRSDALRREIAALLFK
ncbi:MAG: V-type ATP synthase subunit E [Candidatus Bilamarchaeaceae archaeon]